MSENMEIDIHVYINQSGFKTRYRVYVQYIFYIDYTCNNKICKINPISDSIYKYFKNLITGHKI